MKLLIAVSGVVASGKSTLVAALLKRFPGALVIATRSLIGEHRATDGVRAGLQSAGDDLDAATDGAWVADGVGTRIGDARPDLVIVDAVRRGEQVEHLRRRYGAAVRHVHLTADRGVVERRHAERRGVVVEPATYADVAANPTEAAVDGMAAVADVVIDTTFVDAASVAARALAGSDLVPRGSRRLVDVIVGAQYGSEGKGNVCAFLAREYQVLMRVGGPNAGHKVADPYYTFVHLPSGTKHNPDAKLLIGAGATISLEVLFREIEECDVGPDRLSVDPQAIIIEPSDVAWEMESLEVIGSTKKGVGAATARKILGRDGKPELGAAVRLARDVPELAAYVRPVWVELENAYAAGLRVMLEGTQGTDLSIHHGRYPSVTSRETTASGCMADAGIAPGMIDQVIMVTRTYPIRVGGTSGEMDNELESTDIVADRAGLPRESIASTEIGSVSGKKRRMAEFSMEQVRRAAILNGATAVALTFADYLGVENTTASSYAELTSATRGFIEEIERVTGVPVTLVSTRFHADGMIDRRPHERS